jgi:Family of unknown function (DUF6325)
MPGSANRSISSPACSTSAWQVAATLAHGCEQQQRVRAEHEHAVDPEPLQRPPQLLLGLRDLVFVKKQLDGSVTGVAIADLDKDGKLDLAVFEGAASGLLGQDDLEEAGGVLEPGSSAGLLVYENRWAAPFARALRRGGGQLVASGRIPVQAVLAALDAAEARS